MERAGRFVTSKGLDEAKKELGKTIRTINRGATVGREHKIPCEGQRDGGKNDKVECFLYLKPFV
jgi:hypothetical protein